MMHLEIGGARVPVPAGETIIGSAPGSAIVLEGEGVQPRHAILQGTAQGAAAIRVGDPRAELLVNGIRLGADPTPVLHGDKIQIGPHEILAVDDRRIGNTQLFDSGAFTDLAPPPRPSGPAASDGPAGGRLVCLTDGREYTISGDRLVFGRDASYSASSERIAAVFGRDQVWSLRPTREGNTVIVAARDVKIPGRDELTARAANIEDRYGLPARKWLRMVRPLSPPAD